MFTLFTLISPMDMEFIGLFSPISLLAGFFIAISLILVLIISFFIWLGRFLTVCTSKEQKEEPKNKDEAIGFALKNKNIRSE